MENKLTKYYCFRNVIKPAQTINIKNKVIETKPIHYFCYSVFYAKHNTEAKKIVKNIKGALCFAIANIDSVKIIKKNNLIYKGL